jgi:hypothetical protein
MTGINIQYPWSQLLIDQHKCVETRSYPLIAPQNKGIIFTNNCLLFDYSGV